jgi:hypothetical protein
MGATTTRGDDDNEGNGGVCNANGAHDNNDNGGNSCENEYDYQDNVGNGAHINDHNAHNGNDKEGDSNSGDDSAPPMEDVRTAAQVRLVFLFYFLYSNDICAVSFTI